MIAAYSSGVAVRRLLDAILGTSPVTWIWAKRPSAVKIRMPLGVSPNGNDLLPSGAVTSATTKSQLPTIRSLRLCAGCAAAAPADRASASKAAAMVLGFMVSSPGNVLSRMLSQDASLRDVPQFVGWVEPLRNPSHVAIVTMGFASAFAR